VIESARPELEACTDLIEQLCACMRAIAAHGVEHDDVHSSAQASRRAIAAAKPPFGLRFLSDSVLREREPLSLNLAGFRRSQILARALYQQNTPELRFSELPKLEVIVKLAKLFVESTQGNHRSFMPKLPGIGMHKLHQVDPTSNGHDETDVDRVLRAELYFATTRVEALHRKAMATGVWPWLEGQHAVAALERCLSLGVTATARALELAAPEWTPARRGVAMVTNVLTVLTRLRASDVARRAGAHAMLAIAGYGFAQPNESFATAAQRALEAVHRAPAGSGGNEPVAPSPHRLRTTALLSGAAGRSSSPMALARLLHAAFTLEGKRIDASGQRLSRIDLQAWLSSAIGREVDDAFGRAMLSALGAYPPGAHVLCDGRLGVVVGPGKAADRPILLVGGALCTPDAAVTPASPLGMSPWAK
jgi:hypothetical protein